MPNPSNLPIPEDKFSTLEKALLDAYARENPEFQEPRSKFAQEEIAKLFYQRNGELLPDNEIQKNIRYFCERISHLIPQLAVNKQWQIKKEKAKLAEVQGELAEGRLPRAVVVADSEETLAAAPRTLVKTWQDIFSRRCEQIAFPRPKNKAEQDEMIEQFTIDADSISPKLIVNLGLEEYLPPKKVREEEKLSYYGDVIPELRAALKAVEPIVYRDPKSGQLRKTYGPETARIMRIGRGTREEAIPSYGKVLGTQENHGKKIAYVSYLHDAKRRLDEIDENYRNEIKQLVRIEKKIEVIDSLIARHWERTKDLVPQWRAELLEFVEELQFVEDEDKVKLKEKITRALTFSTETTVREKFGKLPDGSRGVVRPQQKKTVLNPGATRAKWAGFPNDIAKRKGRMRAVSKHLGGDKAILRDLVETQHAPFSYLFRVMNGVRTHSPILNYQKAMLRKDWQKEVAWLISTEEEFATEGENTEGNRTQFFEPFLTLAKRISVHSKRTRAALQNSTLIGPAESSEDFRKNAAKELVKVYQIAALEHIYRSIQNLADEAFVGDDLPFFRSVRIRVETLKKEVVPFGGREIKVTEYTPVILEIWAKLDQLIEKAKAGAKAMLEDKEKEAKKIYAELKVLIDEVQPDLMIKKLSNFEDY